MTFSMQLMGRSTAVYCAILHLQGRRFLLIRLCLPCGASVGKLLPHLYRQKSWLKLHNMSLFRKPVGGLFEVLGGSCKGLFCVLDSCWRAFFWNWSCVQANFISPDVPIPLAAVALLSDHELPQSQSSPGFGILNKASTFLSHAVGAILFRVCCF